MLQRRKFFQGRADPRRRTSRTSPGSSPTGKEMTDEDWDAGFVKCLGMRLAGDLIGEVDERGEPIVGDTLLLLLNAHHEPIPFTLPPTKRGAPLGAAVRHGRRRRPAGDARGGEQYPLAGPVAGRVPDACRRRSTQPQVSAVQAARAQSKGPVRSRAVFAAASDDRRPDLRRCPTPLDRLAG